MRRTLYRKLILIYVILAIAGFTLISTVGSRMVEDSLVSSASTSLYREATQIASKQGDLYYHSERSLTDLTIRSVHWLPITTPRSGSSAQTGKFC